MSTISWVIVENRLQTLLDRAQFLLERADFLEALSTADFQHTMLQAADGAVAFCEKPLGAVSLAKQPSEASRQAALSQREKILAEHAKVNSEIAKVLKHLELREPMVE